MPQTGANTDATSVVEPINSMVATQRRRAAKIAAVGVDTVIAKTDSVAERRAKRQAFLDNVSTGTLESVATDFKTTEVGFAEAMLLYNQSVANLGEIHLSLQQLSAPEQRMEDDAVAAVKAAEVAVAEAPKTRQMWVLKLRDKAIASADAQLVKAKSDLEMTRRRVQASMEQRIKNAPVDATIESFLHQADQVVAVLEEEDKNVTGQLESVQAFRPVAFAAKEKAAQDWKKAEVQVEKTQKAITAIEAELAEITPGTPEAAEKEKERAQKISELEQFRAELNLAISAHGRKEKTIRELAGQEPALIQVQSNIRQQIDEVRTNKEDRAICFRAAVQLVHSMAQQKAADMHDATGETMAIEMLEAAIKAFQASENTRLSKLEKIPAEIQARHDKLIAMGLVMDQNRVREEGIITKAREGYGTEGLEYSELDVHAGNPAGK